MMSRDDPHHDRACKVRPVLEHFNQSFLLSQTASKYQSIYEHMVKFKGHSILRQYVKGKPIQWRFKLWCRCDSKTGYLYEFDLYLGKKNMVEHGLGEGVVLNLTQKIEHIGCKVVIDNFFNSPLQIMLLEKDIFCTGTVTPSRKLLPKKDVPSDKDMKRGDVRSFEASGINCVKWMDSKPVHMLSNFLAADPKHEIKRRKKRSEEQEKVICPNVANQYYNFMGGVDLIDQKKVFYQFDHRSKFKYYLRIVFDIIDIAIYNSHVIYTKLSGDTSTMGSKTFRRSVARSLIGNYTYRKRPVPCFQ